MFRPEYLFVGAAFVVLAADPGLARRPSAGSPAWPEPALLLLALLLPIVPWTIRNVDVLDRVVPISTGSGKALYVGTYLPADGEYQRVKAILASATWGATWTPTRRRSTRSTRRRSSTASPPAIPDLPATPPWARSASRTSPSTSATTRSTTRR